MNLTIGSKHIHPVAILLGTLMQSSNTVMQFTLPSVFAEIVNLGAITLEGIVCGAVELYLVINSEVFFHSVI